MLKAQDGALTAVWQPGTGAQVIELGLSTERFVAEDTAHFAAGLRLQALEVHTRPVVVYKLPFGDATGWVLANGNWDDPVNGHGKGDPTAGRPTRTTSTTPRAARSSRPAAAPSTTSTSRARRTASTRPSRATRASATTS